MFVKRLSIALTAFAVVFFSMAVSYADEGAMLSQVCAWEQNIDVYIAGDLSLDSLNCKISNREAEIIASGSLTDGGVVIRTTILVDISKSIPSAVRGDIIQYLDTLIKNINKNEQYKIAVFGEQMTILQDFTSDRYDLSNAVEQIEFDGRQSIIYDAIYNTLPEIQLIDSEPCYYRTILITDGIDDTENGITKEELYLELRTDTYPVNVVAVSESRQTEPNKELSALARISGGKYINLYAGSDLETLLSEFFVDHICWLRAVVPGALLDGSTRQIDISDGNVSLQFDVKVPVYDIQVAEIPAPAESETETGEPESSDTIERSVRESVYVGNGSLIVLCACAGGGVLCMIVVVIVLSVMRKNHKKKGKNINSDADIDDNNDDEVTEMVTNNIYYVQINNADKPEQGWNLSLSKGITIGRDTSCQITLADKSVSRLQCRLYLDKSIPMVKNTSKSNITRINGETLHSPHMIKEGDRLGCGRITLLINLIYTSHPGEADRLNKMTEYVNL